ncbi:hypothetical protein RR48_11260 [Papilio machaon]|uniref:Uncharacterized protein n=1 Tax=Papilio machaon TaxID=76193 RepID=A0A194QQT0_PAPMA|nr:hypothetical protein RR48_11260 [Papilio machaon]
MVFLVRDALCEVYRFCGRTPKVCSAEKLRGEWIDRAERILFLGTITRPYAYNVRNHPCCQEPSENLTLGMIIDAYEIYGHDPTDKLDFLVHYQIEMMKIKRARDQVSCIADDDDDDDRMFIIFSTHTM